MESHGGVDCKLMYTIEDGIEFWFKKLGLNIIPLDTVKGEPVIEAWKLWKSETTPDELQLHWERKDRWFHRSLIDKKEETRYNANWL